MILNFLTGVSLSVVFLFFYFIAMGCLVVKDATSFMKAFVLHAVIGITSCGLPAITAENDQANEVTVETPIDTTTESESSSEQAVRNDSTSKSNDTIEATNSDIEVKQNDNRNYDTRTSSDNSNHVTNATTSTNTTETVTNSDVKQSSTTKEGGIESEGEISAESIEKLTTNKSIDSIVNNVTNTDSCIQQVSITKMLIILLAVLLFGILMPQPKFIRILF